MITIRPETHADGAAREALLDRAFGPTRHGKTCERLRAGRLPARGLALVAEVGGRLCGTVRLWHVAPEVGRPVLLLGPLAVDPAMQRRGLGTALMDAALDRAAALGHGAVVLMGAAGYYARFGFAAEAPAGLVLDGDPRPLLARELVPGTLAGAAGKLRATGALALRLRPSPACDLPRAA